MAVCLFNPTNKQKGLVVFTHKEERIILNNAQLVKSLRRKYFIGIHLGHYVNNPAWLNKFGFDFIFGNRNICPSPLKSHIPISSRDFTGTSCKELVYDFIWVGFATHHKRLDILLENLDFFEDSKEKVRVLLVCPKISPLDETHAQYLKCILGKRWEFVNVDIVRPYRIRDLYPLHKCGIYSLMQNCAALLHTSTQEGEARVIEEASQLGLRLYVRSDLKGGGGANVSDESITRYSHPREILSDYNRLSHSVDISDYQKLHNIVSSYGFILSSDINNVGSIDLALPSQVSGLSYCGKNALTCDLTSALELKKFFRYLDYDIRIGTIDRLSDLWLKFNIDLRRVVRYLVYAARLR